MSGTYQAPAAHQRSTATRAATAVESGATGTPALVPITVTVNGAPHEARVEPRQLLVHFLRETLGLTGTHVGCDTSQCGACAVLMDGAAVKSCTVLAAQADGSTTLFRSQLSTP